jgi:hypothetical protein
MIGCLTSKLELFRRQRSAVLVVDKHLVVGHLPYSSAKR